MVSAPDGLCHPHRKRGKYKNIFLCSGSSADEIKQKSFKRYANGAAMGLMICVARFYINKTCAPNQSGAQVLCG